jgi:hypothetical protein
MTPTAPDAPRPWLAADLDADRGWVRRLSADAVDDLLGATRYAARTGKTLLQLRRSDFPLSPGTRDELAQALALTQGRWGLCLLKGFPVRRWTEDEARLAYWGVGLHLGVARTQNRASDVLNDVRDAGGKDYRVKGGRGYNTNLALDFHIDFCDVVALLCRRQARDGGTSLATSSLAIVETMRREHPAHAAALEQPIPFSWQGTQAPDDTPTYLSPMLGDADGVPAFRTNRKNIVAAQRDFPEVPRLTPLQAEAVEIVDRLAADPRLCFAMRVEEGDLQLVNNFVVIHSRTAFEDHDAPDERRHLLRLWLAVPGSQPLPGSWQQAFKDVRAGAVRGGVRGSGITPEFLAYEAEQARSLGMPNAFTR